MRKRFGLIPLFLYSTLSTTVLATGPFPTDQWERDIALAAARSVNVSAEVRALSDINTLADGQRAIEQIRSIENRSDWPLPAREAAIYQYARSLAELPQDAVSPQIIDHLRHYQPRVVVPHDDHPSSLVPLFNIAAATAGVEHGWQQSEFAFEAQSLLATNPAMIVSRYIESTNPNQQRAIIAVIRDAAIADILTVQDEALRLLGTTPSLTPLVAATASLSNDMTAIESLLINGDGPGISTGLMTIGEQVSQAERGRLLTFAIANAPPVNATIAMATWAPSMMHEADIRELLIQTLDDPALGASAALLLSQQPDIQTIQALSATAAGDSVAARRAQMALDMSRTLHGGGMQP